MKTFKVAFTAISMLCLLAFSNPNLQAGTCPFPSIETLDSCPTAKFSIANNGATTGTPIQFVNQSIGATSYLWDFGDGAASTAVNPSHVYAAAGTYTVKLYATFGGCTVEFIGTEDVVMN